MEAFKLLHFLRIPAGDEIPVGRFSDFDTTTSSSETTASDGCNPAAETDNEDSFFELEFTAPGSDENLHNRTEDSGNGYAKTDVASKQRANSKTRSPIPFVRSPPKLRILPPYKNSKSEKAETTDFSPIHRVNSSKSYLNLQKQKSGKRFPTAVVQKYLKLIKPLYSRASKRYTEEVKFSGENSISAPAKKQAVEKQGSGKVPVHVACKHLGKSRSAGGNRMPPASRRDDSVLLQHDDGIQSAILHCKRSYNSSREFPVNLSKNSSPEVKTRSII